MIGLILAGGKSLRFKSDKALYYLPNRNQTNVELAVNNLRPFCSKVFISANQKNFPKIKQLFNKQKDIKVICDQETYQGLGPLSGIYSFLKEFDQSVEFLTIAVDYPYLTKEEIWPLLSKDSYLITEKKPHFSLFHLYGNCRQVTSFLAKGDLRLKDFVTKFCRPVKVRDSKHLINLNYQNEVYMKTKNEMSENDFQKLLAIVLDDLSIRRTLLENREQEVNQELNSLEKDAELEQLDMQIQLIQQDYDHYREFINPEVKFDLNKYYSVRK